MRLAALTLILLLAASAADAASQKSILVVPPSPAAGLRGEQTTGGATPSAPMSRAPGLRLAAQTPEPQSDPAECRQACGHAYYFCLAGEAAADCPQTWTSCLADCSRTAGPLRAGSE